MELYGIDLSHWNGAVDFTKIKKDFVILNANQMARRDENFEAYYKGAKAAGLKVGAYVYVGALSVYEASVEIDTTLDILKDKNLDLGVWLDVEDSDLGRLNTNEIWDIIVTEVQKLGGYFAGIYCNKNWYNNILQARYYKPDFKYWIASLPYNDLGTKVDSLNPKSYIWQYSFKGSVPGINGPVDLDYISDYIEPSEKLPEYVEGKNYTLLYDINVRKGPSRSFSLQGYDNLTEDGKKHDTNKNGALETGTEVTCLAISRTNNEIWLRIPSGWVCAYNKEDGVLIC